MWRSFRRFKLVDILRPPKRLFVFIVVVCLSDISCLAAGEPWYKGCYTGSVTNDTTGDNFLITETFSNPVECSLTCLKNYQFIGLNSIDGCFCLAALGSPPWTHVHNELCNLSCTLPKSDALPDELYNKSQAIELPCGGRDSTGSVVTSIYGSRGPVLNSLSINIRQSVVYVGQTVDVEATAYYVSDSKTRLGVSLELDAVLDASEVLFVWQRGTSRQRMIITAAPYSVQSLAAFTFTTDGLFTVDVFASNEISVVNSTIDIVVVLPIPRDVKLTVISSVEELPHCHPVSGHNQSVVHIFENQPVEFEAFVPVSGNLTLVWTLVDISNGRVVDSLSLAGSQCDQDDCCTTSVQTFTVEAPGYYVINVIVSNDFGAAEASLTLMASPRGLENVAIAPQSDVVVTGQRTTLSVNITTTMLENLTLTVDHDDGSPVQSCMLFGLRSHMPFELLDMSCSTSESGGVGDDFAVFHGNYSSTCHLSVEIHHVYAVEGLYNPRAFVGDGTRNVSAVFVNGSKVGAQNRLVDVSLVTDPIVGVGSSVRVEASMSVVSQYASYQWTIEHYDRYEDLQNVTEIFTLGPVLELMLEHVGIYVIDITVSNAISEFSSDVLIKVVMPLSGLTLSCGNSNNIMTHVAVQCTAAIAEGDDAAFSWNISGVRPLKVMADGRQSEAVVAFAVDGHYVVSVRVSNSYNSLSAELLLGVSEPLAALTTAVVLPVRLGDPVDLMVCCVHGSEVEFTFGFGDDRPALYSADSRTSYVYHSPGIHTVLVLARNNVSDSSVNITVDVQQSVVDVQLKSDSIHVVGRHSVFLASVSGLQTSREDLLYTWLIDEREIVTTRECVFGHVFNEVNAYTVCVIVHNSVSNQSDCLRISVAVSDDRVALEHDVTFQFPSVALTVLNFLWSGRWLNVSFGDGTVDVIETVAAHHSLQHVYSAPGVYEISLSGNDSEPVRTVVSVQTPVSNVQLIGPSFVPVTSMCNSTQWLASVPAGSDLVYLWYVDAHQVLVTTRPWLNAALPPGVHTLTVTAVNGISDKSATLTVSVIEPLKYLDASVKPVILGHPSPIEILLCGDRELNVNIDYGDGQSMSESYSDADTDFMVPHTSPLCDSQSSGSAFVLKLNHTYSALGNYLVIVDLSNRVSQLRASVVAAVGNLLSNVTVTAEFQLPVPSNSSIALTASVSSGHDVTFSWTCDECPLDPHVDNSLDGSCKASFYIPKAGVYEMSVEASNPYSDRTQSVSTVVTAIDRVVGLRLSTSQDAGKLQQDSSGNWTTGLISFTASVDQGTNVTFTFEFGDNSSAVQSAALDSEPLTATGHHSYSAEGMYLVRVTAANALGSTLTFMEFAVQKPVFGLSLNTTSNHIQVSNDTVFAAYVLGGTDVQFDWDFGDEVYHGAIVTHKYLLSGEFTILLHAHNMVSSENASLAIVVQDIIQSVELIVDGTVHKVTSPVQFSVVTHPSMKSNAIFTFSFGDGRVHLSSASRIVTTYEKSGVYFASVTAKNDLGSVTSEKVAVQLLDEVTDIRISVNKQQSSNNKWTIVSTMTTFIAMHFRGTNTTYDWDFGDGTPLPRVSAQIMKHNFSSLGAFNVTLFVSNLVSNRSASVLVFVLESVCVPPEITLYPEPYRNAEFTRASQIHIEADVQTNCTITSSTLYLWTLYNASTNAVISLSGLNLDRFVFHDPILLLPPRSLLYGRYLIELKVAMNETIVYSSARTSFTVLPSPVLSVISGGFQRYVSRTMAEISLDGSESRDLDFPEANDLQFMWTCSQFASPDRPCFSGQNLSDFAVPSGFLSKDLKHVYFKGELLLSDASDFLFTLTVWKPDRDRSNTTQLLTVGNIGPAPADTNTTVIDVAIRCEQCNDALVNADSEVYLEALNVRFTSSRPNYTWELYTVAGGTPIDYQGLNCVPHDHSLWSMMLNHSFNGSLSSTVGAVAEVLPTVSTLSMTTKLSLPSLNNGPRPTSPFGVGGAFLNPDEGSSNTRGGGRRPGPVAFPIPFEENTGGGPRQPVIPSTDVPVRATTHLHTADAAIDDTQFTRSHAGFALLPRSPVHLAGSDTASGLSSRNLVIKRNVLTRGLAYIVKVTASYVHSHSFVTGTALTYFEVNHSPQNGICTLKPKEGIEMKTLFKVFCTGWMDKNMPLKYEVSFSKSDQKPRIIYRGLLKDVSFHLPAGDAGNNYTVNVHISVLDSLNAATAICSIPVSVLPSNMDEQTLYDVVESTTRVNTQMSIKADVGLGNNRIVRFHAALIASQLNVISRNTSYFTQNSLVLRTRIRRSLLSSLVQLPVRDVCEVQQTLSAVGAIAAVPEELDVESCMSANDILGRTLSATASLLNDSSSDLYDLLPLGIDGSSLVLRVTSMLTSRNQLEKSMAKKSVTFLMSAIDKLLQIQLKYVVTGMPLVSQSTSSLSSYVACYPLGEAVLNSYPVTVMLPSTMFTAPAVRRLTTESNNYADADCYRAAVAVYPHNPFVYGSKDVATMPVATVVTSVNVYTCSGRPISVNNLTEKLVQLAIPNSFEQSNNGTDGGLEMNLDRNYMNIHKFNISSVDLRQPLHVDIMINYSEPDLRPFPVAVVTRGDHPPTLTVFDHMWPSKAGVHKISATIKPERLSGRKVYYIGVLDGSYNSGRIRVDQASSLTYKLRIWSGKCVYWDNSTDSWSGDGCILRNSSTYHAAYCQCNHLTSFAVKYLQALYSVSSQSIDSFFTHSKNPVVPSVIASLLAVYAVLIVIVLKLDHHDDRKSDIVRLIDNCPFDRQKYYISLETGFRKGAGTTAKVSMVLHGEYGMSETRELVSQSGQPLFERNSRDTFFMTFPESLGRIFKVQLWHNNGGSSPSWYLSRVVVKDACTGETYYFVFEKWFAVEKEDGKVEREVMAADKGLGFTKVLQAKSTQYLTDYHLWFSAFVKPSYSRFTRAQRMTCCLCLLMSYMALGAMWFYFHDEEYRGEFALIDISWASIVVGIVASLIALPPNLLICLLFRRSVICRNGFEEHSPSMHSVVDKPADKPPVNTTSVPADPPATTESSMFYQSVMNWRNLQEWAQRAWAKHYQQSPIGSTQNVKPIIVQGDASSGMLNSNVDHILPPVSSPEVMMSPQQDEEKPPELLHANNKSKDCLQVPSQTDTLNSLFSSSPSGYGETFPSERVDQALILNTKNLTGCCTCCQPSPDSQQLQCNQIMRPKREQSSKKGKKSRSNTSSEGSSPATSFSENSPKPPRRALLPEIYNGSDQPSSLPSTLLPPPCYGVFQRSSAARSNSEQLQSSNRSSVKSARSTGSGDGSKNFRSLKADRCFLPHRVLYVAWALCVITIVGCASITVYLGINFSNSRGIVWLQSVFFSTLQSFFITQPLIVVLMTVYMAIRYRNDMSVFDHHSDGIICHGTTARTDNTPPLGPGKGFSIVEGIAARQRSRYLRFARPPQERRLIEARNITMKEANASALINETLLFVIQFLLLVFITFGKSPGVTCQMNSSLRNVLATCGPAPFVNITSIDRWWTWIQGPLLMELSKDSDDKIGGVANSIMVGKMNVRQLRIRPRSCDMPNSFLPNSLCFSLYGSTYHDNRSYGNINDTAFVYQTEAQTGSGYFQGNFGVYGGDGFVASFSVGTEREAVVAELQRLKDSKWIDSFTSAVIVEFTLFHTQSTLFSSVMLVLELPPIGVARTKHHIVSVFLYKYTSSMDHFILACELLFFVAMLVKVHHETIKVLRIGVRYVKNVWNAIEVSQCLLSLTLVVGLVYRFLLITETIERFRSTYFEEYVDVSHVEYLDKTMDTIASFVLLLVGLHLLKSLRHHQPFAMFSNIYEHASIDIIVFAWMFLIWLGAYTSLGLALFGGVMSEFGDVGSATASLASIITGVYDFQIPSGSLGTSVDIGWRIFATVFIMSATGSMSAYMRAVLTFYYKVFKDEPVLVFSCRDNIRYYWNRLQELLHLKSPGGCKEPENPLPPEFTMAEIQYQVDEMLFKMNALAGMSNLPEKPSMYFTDSDTTCGGPFAGAEDGLSSGGSEVRPFDEDKFENRMQKLKDNLFVHDPHLAQLMRLNSMGVTAMEQETEQQLLMQLELEIFRQLQMKRRDNRPSDSSDTYAMSGLSSNPLSQISSNPPSSSNPGSGLTSNISVDGHAAAKPVDINPSSTCKDASAADAATSYSIDVGASPNDESSMAPAARVRQRQHSKLKKAGSDSGQSQRSVNVDNLPSVTDAVPIVQSSVPSISCRDPSDYLESLESIVLRHLSMSVSEPDNSDDIRVSDL